MARPFNIFNAPALNCARDLPETPACPAHITWAEAAYEPGGQLNINNTSGCQLFRTGYRVCFAFLDFYKANGGATQFGNPISPFEFHENLIVQYFEMARFEWRADRPEGQRVVITDLGRTYFDQLGEDPAHLKPVNPLDATINPDSVHKSTCICGKACDAFERPANCLCDRPKPDTSSCFECHRQGYHPLARWSNRRVFLHNEQCGLGTVYIQFCRSKAGGTRADRYRWSTYQGLGGTTTNIVQDLVLILDSRLACCESGSCFIPNISPIKNGPSLQAIFQSDFNVTAHTPHSAIPPHGMGVRMRTCASCQSRCLTSVSPIVLLTQADSRARYRMQHNQPTHMISDKAERGCTSTSSGKLSGHRVTQPAQPPRPASRLVGSSPAAARESRQMPPAPLCEQTSGNVKPRPSGPRK